MSRGPAAHPSATLTTFLRPGDKPACRTPGVDPDWWFPARDGHGQLNRSLLAKARAVCRICPLAERCANWAAENHVRFGVWGGLTSKQLDQRRRCLAGRCHHPICWEEAA